ncbi:MAG TPA: 4Fe-4S binding protein [Methanospirillum sp.]|uniref:ATP-binding protein n=1 Tax=Methanospirillum sp. TaxID=45200 RepID=UPI002C707B48|nr:4Fe-4S binding protein [Methanospirillum sp.]HWQ64206.1 4Fe-4S binding protein [Methanospirillum sp.]
MKRKIITIDEEKCTGCGQCIPDCPEGALQLLDGKARLISDLFCDGLGACIGTCPEGAITVIEREAGAYNEKEVMKNIARQGEAVIGAHLEHLAGHNEMNLYHQALSSLEDMKIPVPVHRGNPDHAQHHHSNNPVASCPGLAAHTIVHEQKSKQTSVHTESELRQWPVQLRLLNSLNPYFDDAHLLVAADCVPFAYADFHLKFLKNKILIIFCPKLDSDIGEYITKLAEILKSHTIRSITTVHMTVPCCSGINYVVNEALKISGKEIPIQDFTITLQGTIAE